jgi:hypothetical protein
LPVGGDTDPVCPRCGAGLRGDTKFCRACGSAVPAPSLGVTCTRCQHVNPADSRFCRGCGTALTPAGAAERADAARTGATRRMPAVEPGIPPAVSAGARRVPSTTSIAVIAVLVAAGGAGVALALLAGGKSGHAVRDALIDTVTSTAVTENETTSTSAAVGSVATTVNARTGASATTASNGTGRVFHAPGDNVICEVQAQAARCSVASNNQTFVLPGSGEASHIESGLALSTGSGSLADYGTSVSVGSVTCAIPMEREPRGIVCNNSASGHGFEASQDASRQKTY